jgi:membrane-bound lytic murein transglycosylase F
MKKMCGIGVVVTAMLFFTLGSWVESPSASPTIEKLTPQTSVYEPPSRLKTIKERKFLNVVIINSPTTYYIGPEGKVGFEYDLLSGYADYLGVKLNLKVVNTINEALHYSKDDEIDIIAASLSITDDRKALYRFGPTYFTVQQQVVCHRTLKNKKPLPTKVEELVGLKILVGEDTSYVENLTHLAKEVEGLTYSTTSEFSTEQILEQVWKKEIDCTVVDSNIFSINHRYYPELTQAFAIHEKESLAWIIPKDADALEQDLYYWINRYQFSGRMAELRDYYYSYINLFDYYNTKVFYERIKTRLPKYRKYFYEAAKKYDLPWTLLAAQAYQESHWDPTATSPTGVRGIMMLTNATSRHLGVKNRLNPKESIFGGAKYLRELMDRLPETIQGTNRDAVALAAYNVGLGHIYDARRLCEKLNKDPDTWKDIKTVLPLLSQKRYYQTLKYGYARGSEPVRYVNGIYNYSNILHNHLTDE